MKDSAQTYRLALQPIAALARSRFLLFSIACVALAGLPGVLAGQTGAPFDPGCPYPFADITVKHPIDSDCGISGKSGGSAPNEAQNKAKNNFCATGKPAWVTPVSFAKLQAAVVKAHIPFGSATHLPPDRSVLHNIYTTSEGDTIGEGSVVRLVAFVEKAHYSDVNSGESVNCSEKGDEQNDIHIPTVQTPGTDECKSVTAEMSPHGRPAGWTPDHLNQGAPVRITGQLFFDASHRPCTAGHPQNPKRIAVWEIHPVYAIDVCSGQTLKDCPVDDDTKWHPLEAKSAATPAGQ